MPIDTIDTTSLPFSPEKQRAVLGHTLYDDRFFGTVIQKLEAEWFSEPLVMKTFAAAKNWYKRSGRQGSVEEILDSQDITKLAVAEIQQIRALVAMIKKDRERYGPKELLSEMEIWVKTRLLQLAIPQAAAAFNKREITSAVNLLNGTVKEFHDVHFLDDGESSFDNFGSDLIKENLDRSSSMTFGLAAMDRLIDPYGTGGSLMPGDMTVIMAPTNVGKTSIMITIACANLMQGKAVLFLSHEGRPDEIKSKFMRCLTGMTPPELLRAYMDPNMRPWLQAREKLFRDQLVYVPMNKPGLTVEEVAAAVERYQDKRRLATGRGFDMLVDDYPAKLTTAQAKEGNLQHRHIQELVYGYFVSMGNHHKFHVLVAVQTNREGSKVNRRQGVFKHETRLLHMEDVMESWGIVTQAATVITANRTAEDAEHNKITYLLCKSRQGETGWAVVCNTAYDRCQIHSNDAGAFWYRGEDGLGDKSSDIMNGFKNQVVPSEKIKWFEELGSPG